MYNLYFCNIDEVDNPINNLINPVFMSTHYSFYSLFYTGVTG